MEKTENFNTNIKISFQKVRKDMDNMQKTIEILASKLNLIQQDIALLKEKTNYSPQEMKGFFRQTLDRHSTDTRQTLDKEPQAPQTPTNPNLFRPPFDIKTPNQQANPNQRDNQDEESLNKLSQTMQKQANQQFNQVTEPTTTEKEIYQVFKSLTNKEFLVFTSIYQLEEEMDSFVAYSDISKKLKLSQSSVRDHVNELILKKAPLEKHVLGNRKVSLSIKKGFKSLNIIGKIINLKLTPHQRTLSEI